ncbi:MAG: response regulator [Propionicimonas sp.]|nr:response regulator [Propionicimonas sp.]
MTDAQTKPATVLLYSDDRTVREQVRLALGTKLAADLPEIEIREVATQPAVLWAMDAGGVDLVILDGEAAPAGGMGIAHQLKDEIADCPPVLLLVARVADAWLATWSKAEAVSPFPVDPVRLPTTAAELLRARLAEKAE